MQQRVLPADVDPVSADLRAVRAGRAPAAWSGGRGRDAVRPALPRPLPATALSCRPPWQRARTGWHRGGPAAPGLHDQRERAAREGRGESAVTTGCLSCRTMSAAGSRRRGCVAAALMTRLPRAGIRRAQSGTGA